MKSEAGGSEVVGPEVEGFSQNPGMTAPSSPSNPIHIDSLEHTPSPTYDLPPSQHYINLQKTKPPSPKPFPQPQPELETESKGILNIRPMQIVLPGEKPLIIPDITNPSEEKQAKLNWIAEERARIEFARKVQSEVGKPPVFFDTFVPTHLKTKPDLSSSSTIDVLS